MAFRSMYGTQLIQSYFPLMWIANNAMCQVGSLIYHEVSKAYVFQVVIFISVKRRVSQFGLCVVISTLSTLQRIYRFHSNMVCK